MSAPAPTIAFFGATGGCTNCALVNALRAGSNVVALVRTPSRLTKQLEEQGISESVIASQLTLITGNALDIAAVKSTLTANRPGHLVSHIVSGLGATPFLRWNWSNPLDFVGLDNPTLCGTAAATLVAALTELYTSDPSLEQHKPKLTFVSTTGISNGVEDVPFGIQILYHWILKNPHMDKRNMETTFTQNAASFSGVIGLRPTLLTGGVNADSGIGLEKIRVGTEDAPARGFSISRADVGKWMWVNAVGNDEKRKHWENQRVSMTS